MIQPKTIDPMARKARIESHKAEPAPQNVRPRDPRLARQMQLQNSTQRNFNQRNRTASPAFGNQSFPPASTHFVANGQLESLIANRSTAFNATNMDDSARKSRAPSKNRSSSKDVKNCVVTSKTSLKSQKANSQKSSPKSPGSSSKSSSKSSKSSPSSNRQLPKDQKKDRCKEKESSKQSPNRSAAITALAEAERKIKQFTIPKKRSPSPKDKSAKSITDPKVSGTTKTADSPSPTKVKNNKSNSKSRNYVRHNRDEDNGEIVQQQSPPPPPTTSTTPSSVIDTTTTTPESVANVQTNAASCVPFTGAGDSQSFKSKETTNFVVGMVNISHIVHNLLTRLMMMSIGLISDCINRSDDICNKLIVCGNFFLLKKNFLNFSNFQQKKKTKKISFPYLNFKRKIKIFQSPSNF